MKRTPHPLLLAVAATALVGTVFTGTAAASSDDGDNRHPSGKDRSVEPGGAADQGRSTADPDDDGRGPDRSNGGADRPGGPGGVDLADQDGNNGCGNDDDFEDDNEGWCGSKPKPQPALGATAARSDACPAGMSGGHGAGEHGASGDCTAPTTTTTQAPDGAVLSSSSAKVPARGGQTAVLSAAAVAGRSVAPEEGEVLPAGLTSDAPGKVSARSASLLGAATGGVLGSLAFTGVHTLTLVVAALLAIATGWALLRLDRRRAA